MTAAQNLPTAGFIKHKTPTLRSDYGHKTTIIQRHIHKLLSWNQTCTRRFVLKSHAHTALCE